ncbi:bifunctional dethiobiotin synthetase/7,8-diamino-pelargonic acid aminotransferase [Cucumis melo var. makuwa]|uniref:Bifunctional dethiobiotin synthetase/7,8-diamino-pelargonic acid aminotransferase n=1 Tax=Cucumis melo var. makuwa TaxID=1194695 RepID=A0A5A7U9A0_CUCMM|nr:bifunctional dethiobiotin synthetase/7,8-diamino-pelargonic acid aminotransferase [Cucumis melo var. makuwa]TYK01892.1 bifunctional dethiobiotin synthetase/7,8-diamino-pelargonic acid aminotransferase [Cucumis melo var. makuwa]
MGSLQTAAELLHCMPDIACFAKLMIGGIIPLSATLASNSVFESFIGDSKLWDDNLVYEISSHPAVKRVVALGTLFALELQADGSNACYFLLDRTNKKKILDSGKKIGLEHFKSVKPLGFGDAGKLCGIDQYFAMKAMDKGVMLNRNKVCNIAFFLTAYLNGSVL